MELQSIGKNLTNKDSLIGLAVVTGGALLGFKLLKGEMDKKLREQVERESASNPNVALATRLRGALFPGVHWDTVLNPAKWGYDRTALLQVAQEITDWKAVAGYYQKLYTTTADGDVRKIATGEDYTRFIAIVAAKDKTNPNNSDNRAQPTVVRNTPATGTPVKPTRNNIVINKKSVRVRKDANNKVVGLDWLFSTDYATGTFLGFTTGQVSYNSQDNIHYMQVWWYEGKEKKVVYGWVTTSAEFVEIFANWNTAGAKFPTIKHAERRYGPDGKIPATNQPLGGFWPRSVNRGDLIKRIQAARAAKLSYQTRFKQKHQQ